MNILLSNDDGIFSQGLHVLGRALAEIADVYVAAPTEEKSGSGHGITMRRPLYARQAELSFAAAAWAVEGLPADCVKLAMEELLPQKPDIVVSGINNGPNLGNDIIYSGTVAAAREGFLYGLPALAVSVTERPGNVAYAAEFARDRVFSWYNNGFKPRSLLNINVPGLKKESVKGWRYTDMGWLWYEDVFTCAYDEKGCPYYSMGGRPLESDSHNNSDVNTCAAGYISITPLCADMTDYSMLEQFRKEGSKDIIP
ncbi:MAG: 5'/3'-nucleotidase SurE [Clostridiales bacterium]|nr:5'/3'-nucleotidase SurE [Clostridiales bacterium]